MSDMNSTPDIENWEGALRPQSEHEPLFYEPKLIDASEPAESRSALESDEDTDPVAGTQPSDTDGVEIETLPPRLRTPDSRAD